MHQTFIYNVAINDFGTLLGFFANDHFNITVQTKLQLIAPNNTFFWSPEVCPAEINYINFKLNCLRRNYMQWLYSNMLDAVFIRNQTPGHTFIAECFTAMDGIDF